MNVSGIILAGGKSRRLGVDKAFLRVGGEALVERVLRIIEQVTDDVIIVANERAAYQHLEGRLVGDVYPGKASLGGIYSGLVAADNDQALLVGCDMPFLNLDLLQYMISLARNHDLVVPRYGTYLEPLHAIYHKRCLPKMRELIEADRLRISEVLEAMPTRYLTEAEIDRFDPEHLSFFNINTPQDLARAEALASRRESRKAEQAEDRKEPK